MAKRGRKLMIKGAGGKSGHKKGRKRGRKGRGKRGRK